MFSIDFAVDKTESMTMDTLRKSKICLPNKQIAHYSSRKQEQNGVCGITK